MSALTADQVMQVAEQVFSALVDGEEGLLQEWFGPVPEVADPMVAWVDMAGESTGRAVVTTSTAVAHDLARALLRVDGGVPVSAEDLVDAYGELANVVGGNLKALLPYPGRLGLPQVAASLPADAVPGRAEVFPLAWRGHLVMVTVEMSGQPTLPREE